MPLAFSEREAERFAVDGEFDFFLDGGCCLFITAIFEKGEYDILIILIGLVFDPGIVESLKISLPLQGRSRGSLAQSSTPLHLLIILFYCTATHKVTQQLSNYLALHPNIIQGSSCNVFQLLEKDENV